MEADAPVKMGAQDRAGAGAYSRKVVKEKEYVERTKNQCIRSPRTSSVAIISLSKSSHCFQRLRTFSLGK